MSDASADRPLRIGVSANFFPPDPQRMIYPHSRLLYADEAMANWFASSGAVVYVLPTSGSDPRRLADYVADLDGLGVTGGADVCPRSYGEEPLRPEWEGQAERDAYEIELVQRFLEAGKPVLGVCRGEQILNVALGGTLYQDISTQVDTTRVHRSQELYHRNLHEVDLVAGSGLAGLYPGVATATVNSIHHQGVKDVAPGVVVEARSSDDGVVEAIRLEGSGVGTGTYAVGVQWHPEFFHLVDDVPLLDTAPLRDEFYAAAAAAR
ncbi:MAG: gamma-glutamyl-gamma-aminobutyrate hydrolase family protein [Acidimicrobiia bacterium]|nr:gamma-glutamyl-gamma-aminobutyrate hydrolase family protein [Acidimicrobiia bacterium]